MLICVLLLVLVALAGILIGVLAPDRATDTSRSQQVYARQEQLQQSAQESGGSQSFAGQRESGLEPAAPTSFTAPSDKAAQKGELPGLSVQRSTSHGADEFHYLLNATPIFKKDGTGGDVFLENCEGNACYMQVTYNLTDSWEELYKSPILPPGWSVQTDDLTASLEPGKYKVTATVYVASSTDIDNDCIRSFEESIVIAVG